MSSISPKVQNQITQLQQMQQQMQTIGAQKSQYEMAVREARRATEELKEVPDENAVFMSVGSVMMQKKKEDVLTTLNDKIETLAIKNVFKDHAKNLCISSNKSMIGHLLGASGAVEFIGAVLTLKNGIIPPTINYEVPDPECDLDYVPNTAREKNLRAVISNSFGFGGHNVCLCLKRFEG